MAAQESQPGDNCANNIVEEQKRASGAKIETSSPSFLENLVLMPKVSALAIDSPLPSPFDVPEPLAECTNFRSFPPELRLRVWNMAMPEERIIEVLWKKERGYYTRSQPPAILHACRESRREALKRLAVIEFENKDLESDTKTKSADFKSPSGSRNCKHKALPRFGTYINYDMDKLYLFRRNIPKKQYRSEADGFFNSLGLEVASNIQFIIVCDPDFRIYLSMLVFPGAKNLRSIGLVVDDPCWVCYSMPRGKEVEYRSLFGCEIQPLVKAKAQVLRWLGEDGVLRCAESGVKPFEVPQFNGLLRDKGSDASVVEHLEWFEVRILRDGS